MTTDRFSIIIPAYNEESVIGRTLHVLLDGTGETDFEVIVVCNGCIDGTAAVVRREFPSVAVMERTEASKIAAINAGIAAASGDTVLLLDADIELDADSARALLEAVGKPGVNAAIGHMAVDTRGAHWMVCAFYRVWMEHPYLRHGKFAAAIALSPTGLARVGTLPQVTADDSYLRRVIPPESVAVVDSVRFLVRAPKTVRSLVHVRSRSYRGNRELKALDSCNQTDFSGEAHGLIKHVAARPTLWPAACIYLVITLAARGLSRRGAPARWERDLTTRTPLTEQGV
jgi:glycosyltransferase involved in cell wall biosynthesis